MLKIEPVTVLGCAPAPLVPREVDLSDFEYMPIYIKRLRKSETWINARYAPELGFWSMNLWMSSWQELPAASLENNDTTLSEAAMCDRPRWKEARAHVMRGWILCSDNRWYHPVLAAYALEAWKVRQRYRKTLAVARGAKAEKKDKRQAKLNLHGGQPELPPNPQMRNDAAMDEEEIPAPDTFASIPPLDDDASPLNLKNRRFPPVLL